MCLIVSKGSKLQVATKDIVCYKIAFESAIDEDRYYSLYRGSNITVGEVITEESFQIDSLLPTIYEASGLVDIGFHSLKYVKDAEIIKMMAGQNGIWSVYGMVGRMVIFKCIIPAGSMYWKGRFSDAISYCSNQIKYLKPCA